MKYRVTLSKPDAIKLLELDYPELCDMPDMDWIAGFFNNDEYLTVEFDTELKTVIAIQRYME